MNKEPKPRRIFAGIKLEPELAEKLLSYTEPFRNATEAKVIPRKDVHITLIPPWESIDIPSIIEQIRKTIHAIECFTVEFRRVRYGPTPMKPWLLWAECSANQEIIRLKKSLLKALHHRNGLPFKPHATLARFRENGRGVMKQYPIDESCSFTHHIDTVELFESPHQHGTGYTVLASLPLRKGLGIPH